MIISAFVALWLTVVVTGVLGQGSVTSTNVTTTSSASVSQTATGAPTNLPPCPNSCLNDVLNGVTPSGCQDLSVDCICASTQGLRSIMCCVKARCSGMDQQVTVSTWIATCQGLPTAPDFLNQLGCVNSTGTSNTTTSSSPSSSNTSTNHGLSQGARIGIGVGVGLGCLGLAALCFAFFIWQRRKRSASSPNEFEKAELDGSGGAPKTELDGSGVVTGDEKRMTHELDSPEMIHEINSVSQGPPQELEGSVPTVQELDGRMKRDGEIK